MLCEGVGFARSPDEPEEAPDATPIPSSRRPAARFRGRGTRLLRLAGVAIRSHELGGRANGRVRCSPGRDARLGGNPASAKPGPRSGPHCAREPQASELYARPPHIRALAALPPLAFGLGNDRPEGRSDGRGHHLRRAAGRPGLLLGRCGLGFRLLVHGTTSGAHRSPAAALPEQEQTTCPTPGRDATPAETLRLQGVPRLQPSAGERGPAAFGAKTSDSGGRSGRIPEAEDPISR